MNFIKSAINSLASKIAKATKETPAPVPSVVPQVIPEGVSGRSFRQAASIAQPRDSKPMNGKFRVCDLELLSSQYLKDALAGLGAWSALAIMFAAYEKQATSRRSDKDYTKYEQAKDVFHQWNAATSCDKQMGEEAVIIALDKIAEVPVQKGNEQTDAIIARVLNKDVETVRQDRIKKANAKTQARKEMLAHLVADVWNFSAEGEEATISGAKAAAKAVQTLEWIATTWQGEPASIAAELLLIESDIQVIEAIAQKEEDHEGENQL